MFQYRPSYLATANLLRIPPIAVGVGVAVNRGGDVGPGVAVATAVASAGVRGTSEIVAAGSP